MTIVSKKMDIYPRGGGKTETLEVRDERIDCVKYWLIVLVIAGHVFMCEEFSDRPSCVAVWEWIYMFHMPLFVFLSGYFSRKKDKKKLKAAILKLLEPLIIIQSASIFGKYLFFGSITINDILIPWFALWYLLSLVFWRLLLQIIPDKILNDIKLILIITFGLSVLPSFLPPDNILSIRKTMTFMPFFFMGYYMKGKNLFLPDKYKPICYAFLIITMAIPVFFHDYLGAKLREIDPYYVYRGLRMILGWLLAVVMSIAFINICAYMQWTARQGRLTMHYFIYHSILLPPIRYILGMMNIPMTLITAVVCTLVITIVIGIASFLPFFKELVNPLTFFFIKIKEREFCGQYRKND